MSNPVFFDLPADTWTKVATSVVIGQIRRKDLRATYLQTYRGTGEAAPTLKADGVLAFDEYPNREPIEDTNLIDVYLYPVDIAGRVRVDL